MTAFLARLLGFAARDERYVMALAIECYKRQQDRIALTTAREGNLGRINELADERRIIDRISRRLPDLYCRG
jgi:hypothetical protein